MAPHTLGVLMHMHADAYTLPGVLTGVRACVQAYAPSPAFEPRSSKFHSDGGMTPASLWIAEAIRKEKIPLCASNRPRHTCSKCRGRMWHVITFAHLCRLGGGESMPVHESVKLSCKEACVCLCASWGILDAIIHSCAASCTPVAGQACTHHSQHPQRTLNMRSVHA